MKFYIESKNGHDSIDVPQDQAQAKTEELLKDDKLVTLEQEDGSTELLTESDIPSDEDKKEAKEWADKFEQTKSATATNKTGGG